MVDNTALEGRDDVLSYTSAPLPEPLVLLGPVSAEVHFETDCDHTDVFVRLCDVRPDGTSWNVCDALQRYTPATISRGADGVAVATFDLWPAGHRFGIGHRLRIQVSGGAHPTYARNLGTADPPMTGVRTVPVVRRIRHDPAHPSHVVLPHAGQ